MSAKDTSVPTESGLMSGADAMMEDVGLECQLHADGRGLVTMTIENVGESTVDLLKRGTAWDVPSDAFEVRSGGPIPYKGVIVFRGPATEVDYIAIAPGQTVSSEYPLTAEYAVEQSGEYSVSLRQPRLSARVDGTPLVVQETCGTLISNFEPSGTARREGIASKTQPLNYNDKSCTNAMKAEIEGAERIARQATRLANSFLSRSEYKNIFLEWFGTNSNHEIEEVHDILNTVEDKWTQYDGDCNQGNLCQEEDDVSAWVLPGTDNVHICDPFFQKTTTSGEAQSRAQILVHEKAHLEGGCSIFVAGCTPVTDIVHSACGSGSTNECYGATDARNLAEESSFHALHNAENFAFFVSHIYQAAVLAPAQAARTVMY